MIDPSTKIGKQVLINPISKCGECTSFDLTHYHKYMNLHYKRPNVGIAFSLLFTNSALYWVRLKGFYVVERFFANFSENCSEAAESVGQQREIQTPESTTQYRYDKKVGF